MVDALSRATLDELAFLQAWETNLVPTVSGLTRVRQFQRANPTALAGPATPGAAAQGLEHRS